MTKGSRPAGPELGGIKCPDCDAAMRPVMLPKSQRGTAHVLECPRCGLRLEAHQAARPG